MTTTDRLIISDYVMKSEGSELYELFELVLDMVDWKLYKANICDDFYAKGCPALERLAQVTGVKQ